VPTPNSYAGTNHICCFSAATCHHRALYGRVDRGRQAARDESLWPCTIVHRIEAEWDPAKARANFRKHGVRFADAVTALEDAGAISVRDHGVDDERWVSIGMDSLARILVVVYTWRDERVRLISARPATRREARQYEEGI
jgi:uncharacterized DUF497 family protein